MNCIPPFFTLTPEESNSSNPRLQLGVQSLPYKIVWRQMDPLYQTMIKGRYIPTTKLEQLFANAQLTTNSLMTPEESNLSNPRLQSGDKMTNYPSTIHIPSPITHS